MKKIISTVRRHQPKTKLTLEMITRNPLRVPCLTDAYWATFPERSGKCLARTLRLVEKQKGSLPLPTMTGLDTVAQTRYEDDNVKQCLHVARTQLLA